MLSTLITAFGILYLTLSVVWLIAVVMLRNEISEEMVHDRKRSVTNNLIFTFVCMVTKNSPGMWIFGTSAFIYLLSMDIARIGRSK